MLFLSFRLIYERKTQLIPHFAMFHRFQQKVKLDFVRENEEKESHLFNLLAMEKLGPNLYHILRRSKKRNYHSDETRGKFREGLSLKVRIFRFYYSFSFKGSNRNSATVLRVPRISAQEESCPSRHKAGQLCRRPQWDCKTLTGPHS